MNVLQNYQALGTMIENLVERNQKLEDENERLSLELIFLRTKLADLSPASNHSDSTDEGSHAPVVQSGAP